METRRAALHRSLATVRCLAAAIVAAAAAADELCYPAVVLHAAGSLPSTAPFCVVASNERRAADFSPPPPISSEDEWREFVSDHRIEIGGAPSQVGEKRSIIHRELVTGETSPWQLPSAIQSLRCNAASNVVLNVPRAVDCVPFAALMEQTCENSVLTATRLFEQPFIVAGMNKSVAVDSSSFDVRPTVWRNDHCENFVVKAQLTFVVSLDTRSIVSARLDRLVYDTVGPNNYSTTVSAIAVRYESVAAKQRGARAPTGFDDGDLILTAPAEAAWRIPSGVNCASSTTVKFKQAFVSSCRMRFSSCSEAVQAARQLLSRLPSSILNTPFTENTTTSIAFSSPREQQNSLRTGCDFISGASIVITHSLSGPAKLPKRLITSALISLQYVNFDAIPPNSTAFFLFSLKFVDVTPGVTHAFFSPPRVDLRLPSDFFYPFLFNSAASNHFVCLITAVTLVLLRK